MQLKYKREQTPPLLSSIPLIVLFFFGKLNFSFCWIFRLVKYFDGQIISSQFEKPTSF